jgi:sterol desaturase/sphingolipid hydroxylase (fatty acid hydroxylase superfamily)
VTTDALLSWLPLAAWIWLFQMLVYHGVGLWFESLDRNGALSRFKTRPAERKRYVELLPRVLANQVCVLLPAMLFTQWAGLAFVGPSHLSLASLAIIAIGLTIGHDVVQYVAHRFVLHRPDMMRRLGHSLHHSTTGSRAISACYMSYMDFFLEIVCPYLIPLALVGGAGSNVIFHSLIVSAGAFGGLYEHSGYDFSRALRERADGRPVGRLRKSLGKLASSEAHAAHHSRGNVSFSDGFGSSNICDTLFRTRWDLVPQQRKREARLSVA